MRLRSGLLPCRLVITLLYQVASGVTTACPVLAYTDGTRVAVDGYVRGSVYTRYRSPLGASAMRSEERNCWHSRKSGNVVVIVVEDGDQPLILPATVPSSVSPNTSTSLLHTQALCGWQSLQRLTKPGLGPSPSVPTPPSQIVTT